MSENRLLRLVKRARRGDSNAFCELMQMKAQDIIFISIKLMGNKADGEDVAQEAIISIGRNIEKLKKPQYFNTWAYRIVLNESMKAKRWQQREQEEIKGAEDEISEVAEHNIDMLPEDKMDQSVQRAAVMDCLDTLPERQRLCLLLFYYEDMTYKEIAKTLQTTEAAVANILLRAKENLREELKTQGIALQDEIFSEEKSTHKLAGASFSGMLAVHADELVGPGVLIGVNATVAELIATGTLTKTGVGILGSSIAVLCSCAAIVTAVNFGLDRIEKEVAEEPIVEVVEELQEESSVTEIDPASTQVLKQPKNGTVTAVIKDDGSGAWQDFQARSEDFVFERNGFQGGVSYEIYSEREAENKHYLIVLSEELDGLDGSTYLDIAL